jgi:hypothetical protein
MLVATGATRSPDVAVAERIDAVPFKRRGQELSTLTAFYRSMMG